MRGLELPARQAFDRHLLRDHPHPIAVALSGGGDSLALALLADAWARETGRELLILTVDHGLQTDSAAWTEACAATAKRLGWPFQALRWEGVKPTTGLPAAARRARHGLLADAARRAGAQVILMGHTADDLREAAVMRGAGATTPDPRTWAPSPAWPQGRGVFVLRPLLDVGRTALRAWLVDRGERWIEDPANADLRYARSRARQTDASPAPRPEPPPLMLAAQAREHAGVITLDRAALRAAEPQDAQRFVALIAVCAGGGDRRPATSRLTRATEALRGAGPHVSTLAGARLEADEVEVRVFREAGEAGRGGLVGVETATDAVVWDGRFEVIGEGRYVRRLAGLARRLPADQQRALRALPANARGALPVLVAADGAVTCPGLSGSGSLVGPRFRAAAGLIDREPA